MIISNYTAKGMELMLTFSTSFRVTEENWSFETDIFGLLSFF